MLIPFSKSELRFKALVVQRDELPRRYQQYSQRSFWQPDSMREMVGIGNSIPSSGNATHPFR